MKKTALVIGASSGIGLETAKMLLNIGYKVYNGSRRNCPDLRIRNLNVDVSDRETIKSAIIAIETEEHSLDLVVYSAGFSMAAPVEYVLEADYLYLFEVNLFGFIETVKYVIPVMRKQGFGKIICVSSFGGTVPIIYDSYYSASKSALNMFCYALSSELKKSGIYISSVIPGGVRTEFSFKRKIYPIQDSKYKDMMTATSILCEIEQNGMNPQKTAKCILKLVQSKRPKLVAYPTISDRFVSVLCKFIPLRILLWVIRKKFQIK